MICLYTSFGFVRSLTGNIKRIQPKNGVQVELGWSFDKVQAGLSLRTARPDWFICSECDGKAYLVSGTIHAKRKSMPLQNRFDDVEAQAAAACVPVVGAVYPVKRLEHLLQIGTVNGYTSVPYLQGISRQRDADFRP